MEEEIRHFRNDFGLKLVTERDLGERVGLECRFGGLMSTRRGHVTIIRILQTGLSALRMLGLIVPEQSGSWDKNIGKSAKDVKKWLIGSRFILL